MNCRLSLSMAIFAATFIALSGSPPLVAANGGGGHGAGGGHGGGHAGGHSGGHPSGGSSSGHSFSHSVGHSLGHIFGHHSGPRGTQGREKPSSRVSSSGLPLRVAGMRIHARRRMFHRNTFFSSGPCDSFRFSWRNFIFPGEFDCFSGSFLFDPFFYGASWNTYFWSDSLTDSGDFANSAGPPEAVDSGMPAPEEEPGAAVPLPSNAERPIALLQLLDGSMYGLTRYWLEGTTLHYVTTYGGENSVPLERVDFTKTRQLNAERGTQFDLTKNPHNP